MCVCLFTNDVIVCMTNLFQPVDKDLHVLISGAGRDNRRRAALSSHVPEKPKSVCQEKKPSLLRTDETMLTTFSQTYNFQANHRYRIEKSALGVKASVIYSCREFKNFCLASSCRIFMHVRGANWFKWSHISFILMKEIIGNGC